MGGRRGSYRPFGARTHSAASTGIGIQQAGRRWRAYWQSSPESSIRSSEGDDDGRRARLRRRGMLERVKIFLSSYVVMFFCFFFLGVGADGISPASGMLLGPS